MADTLRSVHFRPAAAAASCPALRLALFLDARCAVAGAAAPLAGRLELRCASARDLRLGEIAVELTAYEEVATPEVTASRCFIAARVLFQGRNLPPSSAVVAVLLDQTSSLSSSSSPPFPARRGTTTFPFTFRIPARAPSSYTAAPFVSLRYVVTACVEFHYQDAVSDTLYKSSEAFILAAAWRNPEVERQARVALRVVNQARPWLSATWLRWMANASDDCPVLLVAEIPSAVATAGDPIPVRIRVTNRTAATTLGLGSAQALCVSLLERCRVYRDLRPDIVVAQTLVAQQTLGSVAGIDEAHEWMVGAGEERNVVVELPVPPSTRSILAARLFAIDHLIVVSVRIGILSRNLAVEMPIVILHPASLARPVVRVKRHGGAAAAAAPPSSQGSSISSHTAVSSPSSSANEVVVAATDGQLAAIIDRELDRALLGVPLVYECSTQKYQVVRRTSRQLSKQAEEVERVLLRSGVELVSQQGGGDEPAGDLDDDGDACSYLGRGSFTDLAVSPSSSPDLGPTRPPQLTTLAMALAAKEASLPPSPMTVDTPARSPDGVPPGMSIPGSARRRPSTDAASLVGSATPPTQHSSSPAKWSMRSGVLSGSPHATTILGVHSSPRDEHTRRPGLRAPAGFNESHDAHTVTTTVIQEQREEEGEGDEADEDDDETESLLGVGLGQPKPRRFRRWRF